MNRGYIKLWRRIEDNVSWSRGLAYRGLMLSLLVRVCRKKTAFRGVELKCGQTGIVVSSWCAELGLDRTSLTRMLKKLQADGFIKISSRANRFTIITVPNWDKYQSSTMIDGKIVSSDHVQPLRQQDNLPNAHPNTQAIAQPNTQAIAHPNTQAIAQPNTQAIAQPNTQAIAQPNTQPGTQSAAQPQTLSSPQCELHPASNVCSSTASSGAATEQDIKKEKNKKSLSPDSVAEPVQNPDGKISGAKESGCDGFDLFWKEYPRKQGRSAALREWKRLHLKNLLPDLDNLLSALNTQSLTSQWQREKGRFVPCASRWLKEEMWNDCPQPGNELISENEFLKLAQLQRNKK
ncbi:hypothetical protein [Maridesulfovibrio bastinii]|uniref:hypothetical protein n=1 Tax=Maridesulfovibrio bastinii TaxID=47157 RepID=UPI00040282CC|nr:hypothetical protein [Maridesulfovibrio bastinii]